VAAIKGRVRVEFEVEVGELWDFDQEGGNVHAAVLVAVDALHLHRPCMKRWCHNSDTLRLVMC
jgi:hypothetical protein